MAKNGLDAKDYSGWIINNIEIDEFTKQLFSEFVIGTPAYNLSQKGRDLYEFYEFKTIADYDKLKSDLIGAIPFYTFETYEKLGNGIIGDTDINFSIQPPVLWIEKIYIYTGTISDNNFYKQYFKTLVSTKGKDKATIQAEAAGRKNTIEIEKLFYHLRNGFAHGCFSIFEQNGDVYYVIQDESGDVISARMVLKASTLQAWIDYLKARKESISQTTIIEENMEQQEKAEKVAS